MGKTDESEFGRWGDAILQRLGRPVPCPTDDYDVYLCSALLTAHEQGLLHSEERAEALRLARRGAFGRKQSELLERVLSRAASAA